MTVTVEDSDGAQTTTSFELVVENVAPSVAADKDTVTIDEAETAVNSGTVSDPGDDTVQLSVDVGAVLDNQDGTWSWSYASTDGPDQSADRDRHGDGQRWRPDQHDL